jgi:formate hydrogenlyase subunit 4
MSALPSTVASIAHVVSALALAPLLPGVIRRTKAWFAGRRGQPLLQIYYDLAKLLKKGAVYSRTTNWVFAAGAIVQLACVAAATLIVPLGGVAGAMTFSGDFLFLAGLLGLMRFATVVAALDTGSSFEGMGASREVCFAALAEPALLLGLTALAAQAHSLSLSAIYAAIGTHASLSSAGPAMLLVAAALGIVFLTENARIPIDDPTTHLELTMIHEAMVLDHGGPDLALIQYASALKLWVLGALLVGIVVPVRTGLAAVDLLSGVGGMILLAVAIGVIESSMARLKLLRVPQFLVAASVLSILALVLVLR